MWLQDLLMNAPKVCYLSVVFIEQVLWQHAVADLLWVVNELLQGGLLLIFSLIVFNLWSIEVLPSNEN